MQEPENHGTIGIGDVEAEFAREGFSRLTEIQKRAAPLILGRRNSLLIAPTGSGKTESSAIPIFSMLRRSRKQGRIKALYITPLRALNRDVFRRITKYAHSNGLSIGIRHGDTPQRDRKRMIDSPPDVLITTPETLVVLLVLKKYLDALSEVEWVVIDEVHELLSSERGAQLALSLERLQYASRTEFTRVGLSATVGNPEEAARFVAGSDRPFAIARDTSVRGYDVEIRHVGGTVTDVASFISGHVAGLGLDSPVLLFANTRGEAEFLAAALKDGSQLRVELHHGSLSREVREETEESLRGGGPGIVVCTSSLELGLDIGSVDLVIHYGSPRQASRLIQRIGRSRHRAGSSARGLIVTNSADDEFEARAILERIREGEIEEQRIHSGSLDVLAHHMVGLALQKGGEIPAERGLEIARRAFPFRDLSAGELASVLELLASNRIVLFDGEKKAFRRGGGRIFRYHFENLSTIPDILRFRVFDAVGKRTIGSLDQRFVGDHGDPGNVFVLKGSRWRVIGTDEKALAVNVEPVRGTGVTVPYWEGESIPVDHSTARRVGLFRARAAGGTLQVSDAAAAAALDLRPVPDGGTIVVESVRTDSNVVLHSCLGTKINATLTAILSAMLSSILGCPVDGRSDAYRIALASRARISERTLCGVLRDGYDNLPEIVSASLSGTHNVNWRTWCVAKRFGIVGRDAVYDRRSARFLYDRYAQTPLVRESLRELFHDRYDLEGTARTLEGIRNGEILLRWRDLDGFSRLAVPILDHTAGYRSNPSSVDKGIMDMVKSRLSKTRHRLVCVRCGRWERSVETCEVTQSLLACPRCRARQIAATYYTDYDLPEIVRKKHGGKRLDPDERHRFERAWKVSSLVENFGKTALIVLSGYGVGADTAARILRNMVDEGDGEGGDLLYRQIYEAERQYVVTRGFWDP